MSSTLTKSTGYLARMDGGPRDVSRRELGQVTPVMLPISKVPGSGAFTGEYSEILMSVGNLIL